MLPVEMNKDIICNFTFEITFEKYYTVQSLINHVYNMLRGTIL